LVSPGFVEQFFNEGSSHGRDEKMEGSSYLINDIIRYELKIKGSKDQILTKRLNGGTIVGTVMYGR